LLSLKSLQNPVSLGIKTSCITDEGRNGALSVNTAVQNVPGYEHAKCDLAVVTTALLVQNGSALDLSVAPKYLDDVSAEGVQRKWLIYPFPPCATYIGSGRVEKTESWKCTFLDQM
jgi:hypothetical protein